MHQIPQRLTFLRQWLANPLMVGAVLPSGTSQARLMTQAIDQNTRSVLELGPGTGVFTEALLKRGLVPEQLTLVGLDASFCQLALTPISWRSHRPRRCGALVRGGRRERCHIQCGYQRVATPFDAHPYDISHRRGRGAQARAERQSLSIHLWRSVPDCARHTSEAGLGGEFARDRHVEPAPGVGLSDFTYSG